MIDLTRSQTPSPDLHHVDADPGTNWIKDTAVAIDAPPDDAINPSPDDRWPSDTVRTGICGAVTPRVLRLADGTYRMYYTQILPRAGHPAGANDYGNATTRVLSATSTDGETWIPDPGIRLSAREGGAGDFRVVVTEVVPLPAKAAGYRMYYECAPGPQTEPNTIRSARSDDGLVWSPEPGIRFGKDDRHYSSARIVFLSDGRCRLYIGESGTGIISAISEDGGTTFSREDGIRIDRSGPYDKTVAFAPEILRTTSGAYIMYYAGYAAPNRAYILMATSDDGIRWVKAPDPVVSPDGRWDAAKCSEVCVFRMPSGEFRMVYEACDGKAAGERGVWRIAGAVASG